MKKESGIQLVLTPEEIVCLQELVGYAEDHFCGNYRWEMELHKSLGKKLHAAYKKPYMSKRAFNSRLEKCRKEWIVVSNSYTSESMLRAVERELWFAYRIEDSGNKLGE